MEEVRRRGWSVKKKGGGGGAWLQERCWGTTDDGR